MSTLGSLHILAPEIPDGLPCWRLQVRVDDGQPPAGGTPLHETLLLSEGELKRIRERATKRPTAILPPPEPVVPAVTYECVVEALETHRADIGKMRVLYDALRANHEATVSSLALANTDRAAVTADRNAMKAALVDARADLATTRADLETAHVDLAALRSDLSVVRPNLDDDRDRLRIAMEAADRLQAELTQSECLRAAQAPVALTPWADLGRALKRALGF